MSDLPDQPAEPSEAGPRIGADEWVQRSGERTTGPAGIAGRSRRFAARTPSILQLLAFVGVASAIPLLTSNGYVIQVDANTLLYVLLAVGLNVAVGWAGLLDLGYVAFYGFAAYVYAEVSSEHYGIHWPTWQSVPIVIAGTMLFGFLLALPSRRLRGDYYAIVTLFFLQIFNNFTTNGYTLNWFGAPPESGLTGGPSGITNTDPFRVFGHVLDNRPTDYVWVAAAGLTAVVVLLGFVNRSRTGRAWRALREDPLAAEAMGIPVKWLMMLAVAIGAGVAGFAGSVDAAYYQGVFPDTFMFPLLITIYAMVILGGVGSLGGVITGAVVVNVLLEVLRTPDHSRWIFYAALLVGLALKLRPWRLLAGMVVALAAFGVIVTEIVGAIWPRGIGGPLAMGPTAYTTHGFFASVLRHWLVLPKATYQLADYKIGNYAFVIVLALVLASTVVKGWKRWAILVPAIWGAALVWETDLVNQAATTRYLLLGVILIVLMATRPAGLFGQNRVEVV